MQKYYECSSSPKKFNLISVGLIRDLSGFPPRFRIARYAPRPETNIHWKDHQTPSNLKFWPFAWNNPKNYSCHSTLDPCIFLFDFLTKTKTSTVKTDMLSLLFSSLVVKSLIRLDDRLLQFCLIHIRATLLPLFKCCGLFCNLV